VKTSLDLTGVARRATLMSRLGYPRYGAQGSDWGTSISTLLARHDPRHVAGIHLTPPLAPPDPATFGDLTAAERSALASMEHSAEWDSGYAAEHSTRPQTIGYALVDSPAALCAWIIEKFWAWTDRDGDLETVLTRDELLDNLMLYWLPGTGAFAARLYWESIRQVNQWITGKPGDTIEIPAGCSVFPKELQRPSRRWALRGWRLSGSAAPSAACRLTRRLARHYDESPASLGKRAFQRTCGRDCPDRARQVHLNREGHSGFDQSGESSR
jgi:pimeloyl-ACP methyl ester carboxylesterase